jgi:hypothetical protein
MNEFNGRNSKMKMYVGDKAAAVDRRETPRGTIT